MRAVVDWEVRGGTDQKRLLKSICLFPNEFESTRPDVPALSPTSIEGFAVPKLALGRQVIPGERFRIGLEPVGRDGFASYTVKRLANRKLWRPVKRCSFPSIPRVGS